MARPLLSGLPPLRPTPTCRACATTFIPLLHPRKTCYHCGFSWCLDHLSVDHKALLPRAAEGSQGGGYDEKNVCHACWAWVKMSSSTQSELAALPIRQLTGYLTAYGIPIPAGAVEKTELVQVILRSVGPERVQSPAREKFYREQSVPHNFVRQASSITTSEAAPSAARAQPAARPPPQARPAQATPSRSTPRRPPTSTTAPAPPRQPAPTPAPRSPAPRARPTASTSAPPVAPPTPNGAQLLTQLLAATQDGSGADETEVRKLSVGGLKAVLNAQDVRHDGVLEKSELVAKVVELVCAERERQARQAERDRQEADEASRGVSGRQEEWEEVPAWMKEEWAAAAGRDRTSTDGGATTANASPSSTASIPPTRPVAATSKQSRSECVVCCDNDATHAPISCGHLSLCKGCSDEIMKTSRECALCRTPVGQTGFLRIFV